MVEFEWKLIKEPHRPNVGHLWTSLDGKKWRIGNPHRLGTKPRSKILRKSLSEWEIPNNAERPAPHPEPTYKPVLAGRGTFDEATKVFKILTHEEIKMGFSLSEGVKVVEVPAGTVTTPPAEKKEVDIELAVQSVAKDYVPAEFWFHEEKDIIRPLKMAVKNSQNALLIGDTGCGKTSVVKYLAAKSKNGYRRVNLNGETTVEDLVGKYKLNKEKEMVWLDGVLTECMRKGLWFCCDEVNAALPEVKFVLHSALDDDRYLVLTQKDGEIVHAHPDFRFFGTMNPSYAGTHTLNRAFEDRFGVAIRCDYPNKADEVKIVLNRTKHPSKDIVEKMVTVAGKCRQMYRKEEITTPFSTRRLIDWAIADMVFGTLEAFRITCLNKMPTDEHTAVLDICDAVFPGTEFRKKLTA